MMFLVYVLNYVYRTLCMISFVRYADYYVVSIVFLYYACFIMNDSCHCNFSMMNYPCYILAGWLDQVVVVVVATPHHRLSTWLV